MNARAVLVGLLVIGCSGPEPYTRSSERVVAPDGAPWSAAQAAIAFHPYQYGAHASLSEHVVLSLQLEGKEGTTLVLDDAYRGDEPGDTPKAEYEQLLDPKFDLRFAPDGHALAVSIDGGTTFRPVLFDLGAPMFCRHESFGADALWAGVPSSRKIALDILASASPPIGDGRLHLEVGEYPRARERFSAELKVARTYACARPDDAELRDALVAALLRPGAQISITSDYAPLAECVASLARDHAELRPRLLAVLGDVDHEKRSDAALALAQSDDETVQLALARALAAVPANCPYPNPPEQQVECSDRRFLRNAFAWSLGVVSQKRGALPADVLAVALTLSRDTESLAKIFGIRMLALTDDAAARARIAELAKEPCSEPIAWTTAWPPFFDLLGNGDSPSCWAAAVPPVSR
ncbi:MAG TPA: hypothetical protein VG755_11890 [Nannocystaceae bacterium]|nr:hypothetical protein [Nannocystaceae bacterium]